jgi:hypothetical protein
MPGGSFDKSDIDVSTISNELGRMEDSIKSLTNALNGLDKANNIKLKINVDTTDAEKIKEVNNEIEKLLDGKIKAPSQKIKYFQSIENATIDLKRSWNDLVKSVNNGEISSDKLFDNKFATSVLRYANAFEALKGDISSISPEISDFVNQMRGLEKYTQSKGYNFTVEGFSEAFTEFDKLKKLGVEFKGFDSIKNEVTQLLSLTTDATSAMQNLGSEMNSAFNGTGTGSMNGAIAAQQEYQEELVETRKEISLTREEMEKQLKSSYVRQNVDDWDITYGLDIDDELSDIEKYSQALDELKKKQATALADATMWQNEFAESKNNGVEPKYDYERWMNQSIEDYQRYTSQIEYCQEQLQNALHNYTPNADGKDGEAIKVLTLLLQNLDEEIIKIREAFGSIDEESGIKSLLSSIQEINQYLSTTSNEIKELTTAISGIDFNISINTSGKSASQQAASVKQSKQKVVEELKLGYEEIENIYNQYNGLIRNYTKSGQASQLFLDAKSSLASTLFDGFDSKDINSQIEYYKNIISSYKTMLSELDVDLSAWENKFQKNIDTSIAVQKKVESGESQVEQIQNLFGTNNNINLDGVIEQLNTVILKLEEISKLVSSGLNIRQALDVGDNAQEVNSETSSITVLEQVIDNVTDAVNRKNNAFKEEANIVSTSTDQEIAELGNLLNWLQTIENQLKEISSIPINIDINKNVIENVSEANSNSSNTNTTSTTSTSNKVKSVTDDAKKAKEEVEETVVEIKQGTTEWNHIDQAAEKYKNILGETYNIVQKIRDVNTDKPKISYQVTGETGNSITLGHDTKLISSTNKVDGSLDQKKQEVALLKEQQNLYTKLQKQSKQAQENRNTESIKEANRLLTQQSSEYEAIYKIKLQEAKLNPDDNANQIQELEKQKQYHQENYLLIEKQLGSYSGIIDNQEKINNLLKIGKTYQDKINVEQAKKNDKSGIINVDTSKEKEISNVVKAYTTLKNTEQEYQKLLGKQDANSLTNNNEIIKLRTITEERNKANEAIRNATNLTDQETNAQKRYNEEVAKHSNLRATTADTYNASNLEKVNSLLANTATKMEKLRNASSTGIYTKAFENAEVKIAEFNEELKNNGSISEYKTKVDELINSLEQMKSVIQVIDINDFDSARDYMNSYASNISDGQAEFIKEIPNAKKNITSMTYAWTDQNDMVHKLTQSYNQLNGQISASESVQKKTEKQTMSFTSWMALKWKEVVRYIGSFGVFYELWAAIKQGVTVVKDLNSALTEMRKVSDESVSSLKEFQKVSFDIADSVGTTAKQIQESTADWMRLGESLDEASESAKTANILLNVSEFDSIDEATESLVAMSSAYSELDKMNIVDKLNEVGNNYAISTDGIATALQKSASALKTANNDMDEAVALVTAGNAVVQDPDSVGAGLRTISLRLTGKSDVPEHTVMYGHLYKC